MAPADGFFGPGLTAPGVLSSVRPGADEARARVAETAAASWEAMTKGPGATIVGRDPGTAVILADALEWMETAAENSVHAMPFDPPYGLLEYEDRDHGKMRAGRGGVWRIPPSFDGTQRAPVPRFTVLTREDRRRLNGFVRDVARNALRMLVPGAHMLVAGNPLLSSTVFCAIEQEGFEKRGEVIRLTQTLRGGDRPKGSEAEFRDVSVMPRSAWEPWGLFRKPLSERTVAGNLRRWGTGGLRRISDDQPFRDVIPSSPTRAAERVIAPHPSLKPQAFMRQAVRALLPMGVGLVYDPFAGGGSTLAAARWLGLPSVGTEVDAEYVSVAAIAIPRLASLEVGTGDTGHDTGRCAE